LSFANTKGFVHHRKDEKAPTYFIKQ